MFTGLFVSVRMRTWFSGAMLVCSSTCWLWCCRLVYQNWWPKLCQVCYEHTPSQQRNSAALICSLSAWHTTSCMSLPFLRKFSVFFMSQKFILYTTLIHTYIFAHSSGCVVNGSNAIYGCLLSYHIIHPLPLSLSPGMPWCWRYQRRRRGSTSSTSCRRPDATPGSPVSTGTYTASPRTTEPSNTTNQQWCHHKLRHYWFNNSVCVLFHLYILYQRKFFLYLSRSVCETFTEKRIRDGNVANIDTYAWVGYAIHKSNAWVAFVLFAQAPDEGN